MQPSGRRDDKAIRDKIASYESSIEDAERRREVKDLPKSGLKNWHASVANEHEAIGYRRTLLGEPTPVERCTQDTSPCSQA